MFPHLFIFPSADKDPAGDGLTIEDNGAHCRLEH